MTAVAPDPDIVTCDRCPNDVDRDCAKFESDDADSWMVLDGQTLCPDCWLPCTRCGEPTLAEFSACIRDGDHHCRDCGDGCGECGRYARSER